MCYVFFFFQTKTGFRFVFGYWGSDVFSSRLANIRKCFDGQFKATVGLGAVKEEQTLQELAEKYQVHLNQISVWKKKLLEDAAVLFERKNN